MSDDLVLTYQRQLLAQAQRAYVDTPISDATVEAFMATRRHSFVRRYRERGSPDWREVTASNLTQHLAILYQDNPLTLFGDDDSDVPSTISQPSFVLHMLDLLRLRPGQAVLELGAGSGWNAALIGHLVGSSGRVTSVEILPELASGAAATIAELGITNVDIHAGDGGDGYPAGAPYDRIVFTAGTYDLPGALYDQLRQGGLMLVVIKNAGGGDNLFLLEKVGEHFESRHALPCGFVQLTGKYKIHSLDPTPVESLPQWRDLQHREVARRPFWWGGKGRMFFDWQTAGIRSFLGIIEPRFRAFRTTKTVSTPGEHHYWGLWDERSASLVIARDDELISYGNMTATERLLERTHRWVDLGMPSASSFTLQVFRRDDPQVVTRDDEWVVERRESQFVWRL